MHVLQCTQFRGSGTVARIAMKNYTFLNCSKRMSMNDGTKLSSSALASHRGHRLQAGQAVKVKRGPLFGMTGMVIGFDGDGGCMIALDVVERGVVLIIEPAAVKKRRTVL